ncbi:MAG TPA: YciI family protein [Polyangia bacterium]|jgi:hypothetical protein|nr:YciI family protein [Polyangia bacterium]
MRFMVLVKGNAQSEAGILPGEKLLSEMGQFNQEMTSAGVMRTGEGLKSSKYGFRVKQSGSKGAAKVTIVDGPFTESKEVIAGFWIINVASKAEAINWIKRVPHTDGEIEIRPLYEVSDFPVADGEQPDGWREKEQGFRDATDTAAPPPRQPGTTRYLVALKADQATESGALPTEEALAQMGALMDGLAKSGALLGGEGLKPSATGARIKFDGEKRTVTDGPFSETKELIAGYSLIQVKTRDEAIAFAKDWLRVHVETSRVPLVESVLEVRPLFELEDFPVDAAEKPDGWRKREQAMRDRQG